MDATTPTEVPSATASVDCDRAGRHLTAYLSGDLDILSVPAVTETILAHVRPDDERLWVDMSATTFCDSSGITMLFQLDGHVRANGGQVVIYDPTESVAHLLHLCDPESTIAVRR